MMRKKITGIRKSDSQRETEVRTSPIKNNEYKKIKEEQKEKESSLA